MCFLYWYGQLACSCRNARSEPKHVYCSPLPELWCFAQHHFSSLLYCNLGLLSTVTIASLVVSAATLHLQENILCCAMRPPLSSQEDFGKVLKVPSAVPGGFWRFAVCRFVRPCAACLSAGLACTLACSALRDYKSSGSH